MHILVTGGAGFIGSHLVDQLVKDGNTVRVLDSCEQQIHQGTKPSYLRDDTEYIEGDVRDIDAVQSALRDIDAVFHCAAMTGAGQSQYDIRRYTDINVTGTATLIDCIVNNDISLQKFVLPSSMMIYGEGAYECREHGLQHPHARPFAQLEERDWNMYCPECGECMKSVPMPETLSAQPETLYGVSKKMQEDLVLNAVETHGLPATILRLFNVYGTRQSLKNPYTGVIAVFLSRLQLGKAPLVYEDGAMTRDFVSVHDVVRAFLATLNSQSCIGEVFNIGTGSPRTILSLAQLLAKEIDAMCIPEVSGMSYKNHILHSYANTSKAMGTLGFKSKVQFAQGIREVIEWAQSEDVTDESEKYNAELAKASLLIESSK